MHPLCFESCNQRSFVVEIDAESTLREACHIANVPVNDRCGGMGACGSCVIRVIAGLENLTAKTPVEHATFYLETCQAYTERLSCQCRMSGPVTLQI